MENHLLLEHFVQEFPKEENNIVRTNQLLAAGDILGHCRTPFKKVLTNCNRSLQESKDGSI